MNFKTIKKTSMVLMCSAVFAATAFAQNSSALNITPPHDDFTIHVGTAYTPDVNQSLQVIKTSFYPNEAISFLSFDLSGVNLTDQKISFAKLHVYGQGTGNVDLLNIDQDNWVYGKEGTAKTELETTMASLNSVIGSSNLSNPLDTKAISSLASYTFNIADLTDLKTDFNKGYYSLALKSNNECDFTASFFSPEEYGVKTAAVLELGLAPVPEPSSLVLGLMGLGSLLGIRKNKKSETV